MSTQATAGDIFKLIPLVMKEIGGVAKTRKNEQQKYSFRGIEDFYLAAHPALIMHGVFCAPEVLERTEYRFDKVNAEYNKTTTWLHIAVKVAHRFYAGDGSSVTVTTWGEGLDNSDKATNKAMSGAMKYALIELFCVPTQDVEDSDRTSPEAGTRNSKPVSRTTEEIPLSAPRNSAQGGDTSKGISPPQGAVPIPPLPPVEELVKQAEANMAAKPGTVPEGCIEDGQQINFNRSFKDALPKKFKKDADAIRHAWLKSQGIVDSNGEGTARAIRKDSFYDVRESAETFAAQYQ